MRRVLLIVTAVAALVVVGFIGRMLLDYRHREAIQSIRRTLVQARLTGTSPAEIEPNWGRLSSKLRSEVEAAPDGKLAQLAYSAQARVLLELPRSVSLADRPAIKVTYGIRPSGEIPLPDRPYLWIAEVEGSWNGDPWIVLDRGSWTPDEATVHELELEPILPDDQSERPWQRLDTRAKLVLYTGDQAEEAARAAQAGEPTAARSLVREQRKLDRLLVEVKTDGG